MNPFSNHPRLRERISDLRRSHLGGGPGFICILDLRRERCKTEWNPTDRLIACAALFSLVMIFTGIRIPTKPAPPLHLDADGLRLAAWKSPTGFLLADDFQATQPD